MPVAVVVPVVPVGVAVRKLVSSRDTDRANLDGEAQLQSRERVVEGDADAVVVDADHVEHHRFAVGAAGPERHADLGLHLGWELGPRDAEALAGALTVRFARLHDDVQRIANLPAEKLSLQPGDDVPGAVKVAERLSLRSVEDAAIGRVEHVVERNNGASGDDHRRRLTDGPAGREPVIRRFMPVVVASHGPVGLLTLDRPERAHAYDRDHLDQFLAGARALAAVHDVLVLTSTGERAFCGGADLQAMAGAKPLEALDLHSHLTFTALARLPVVVVCAIQGAAVAGGFELALACDLRVAGPRASFSLPETGLGILPSAGGTTRLTRLVGASRAKAVILGGQALDAGTALAWGVVNRIADDPRAEALAWALEIAARDPAALALAKAIIDAEESAGSLARERTAEAILYARKTTKGLG